MTPGQTAQLLAHVVAFDRRTVGEADVRSWHAALEDLPLDDCVAAVVAHFRTSREWLMPADVREQVRRIRNERAERTASERRRLDESADDLVASSDERIARLREEIHRLAAQWNIERGLGDKDPRTTRRPEPDVIARAKTVRCSWCKAPPGAACTVVTTDNGRGQPLSVVVHPVRILATSPGATEETNAS